MSFASRMSPTMPTVGVGSIAPAGRLVVEADVAAGDGDVEGAAALGEAVDGLLELVEILRVVRIAEVEVVGEREWLRTGHGPGCARIRPRR